MVNLTRIYTRTGDDGTTALGDMSRVGKNDLRLHAYADTDEANSSIGVAIALGSLREDVVTLLTRVQNDLFDVGADLSTPVVADPQYPALRVEQKAAAVCLRAGDRNEKITGSDSPAVGGLPSDGKVRRLRRHDEVILGEFGEPHCLPLYRRQTSAAGLWRGEPSVKPPSIADFCRGDRCHSIVTVVQDERWIGSFNRA